MASNSQNNGGAPSPVHGRKLAGAPISWGVCEVPGWGRMLPPERVLAEMASLGLSATEMGPVGYLRLKYGPVERITGLRVARETLRTQDVRVQRDPV